MRIAYIECFSGISGDMFLGALIDAGVAPALFEQAVAALNVGARLEISRVVRAGISATKVDVWVDGEKDAPREEHLVGKHAAEHAEHGGHGHSHSHSSHSHEHAPDNGYDRKHSHTHGRGLVEIREIIGRAEISPQAKQTAIAIFEALGAAEAKIHNTTAEAVHFHEVGAVDAMVDIVCAAVGAEALGADEIVCSPLNVGGGTVECAHGTFPVPAPATVELLAQAPVYSSGLQAELVTPTGAAIVKTLVKRFSAFPALTVLKTGYGAGTRDFHGHPNVLRLTIGEPATAVDVPAHADHTHAETVCVLEANLDDLNPQVFGYVTDRLLEEGALDCFAMPVQMKKNRPGTLLTVLCTPADAGRLTKLIFSETTTLGVRQHEEQRHCLARRWENVRTEWGEVRIKLGSMNGTVTNFAPEYEDCRKLAVKHRVPLKRVMQEAVQQYLGDK
jgi:uncharacterized protein (TIGR00299 family) protein